jgi:hypothetical protein
VRVLAGLAVPGEVPFSLIGARVAQREEDEAEVGGRVNVADVLMHSRKLLEDEGTNQAGDRGLREGVGGRAGPERAALEGPGGSF